MSDIFYGLSANGNNNALHLLLKNSCFCLHCDCLYNVIIQTSSLWKVIFYHLDIYMYILACNNGNVAIVK